MESKECLHLQAVPVIFELRKVIPAKVAIALREGETRTVMVATHLYCSGCKQTINCSFVPKD